MSQLKAKLSEQLRKVKAGETVIITERGRPIAVMEPLSSDQLDDEIVELVEAGLLRAGRRRLPAGFGDQDLPKDPEGSVRAAILEERAEGR